MTKEVFETEKDLLDSIEPEVKKEEKKEKPNTDYVDRHKLFDELSSYAKESQEALARGEEKPRMSEFLGDAIIKICTGLSMRYNFINYSFRDDMVLYAIENCLKYVHNYNPEISKYAHAYITQIAFMAYRARITYNKKLRYNKAKIIQNSATLDFDSYDVSEQDEDKEFHNTYIEFLRDNDNFIEEYEKSEAERKAKKKEKDALKKTPKKKNDKPNLGDFE